MYYPKIGRVRSVDQTDDAVDFVEGISARIAVKSESARAIVERRCASNRKNGSDKLGTGPQFVRCKVKMLALSASFGVSGQGHGASAVD